MGGFGGPGGGQGVVRIPLFSLLTLRNSAILEKYFWLASATFFSAAWGLTISKPFILGGGHGHEGVSAPPDPPQNPKSAPLVPHLQRGEGDAGGGAGGAVADGGFAAVNHTLLLQRALGGRQRAALINERLN